ncbi:PaaI family thioesterase [Actinomycetota bacterium]
MDNDVFQHHYPEDVSHCYGCGRLNDQGLHVQSRWDGEEAVATHVPDEKYTAVPGFVYGGLIASLIDCHGTGTASAAAYRMREREMGSEPSLRFVTGRLEVNYVAPTPMGVPLELRGTPTEVKEKKVVVDITMTAEGREVANGRVIAVLAPESMFSRSPKE